MNRLELVVCVCVWDTVGGRGGGEEGFSRIEQQRVFMEDRYAQTATAITQMWMRNRNKTTRRQISLHRDNIVSSFPGIVLYVSTLVLALNAAFSLILPIVTYDTMFLMTQEIRIETKN